MRQFKLITTKIPVTKKATCDWCNKVINVCGVDFVDQIKGGSFSINFGYCSKYDSKYYSFDICDNCFEKHLKKYGTTNK